MEVEEVIEVLPYLVKNKFRKQGECKCTAGNKPLITLVMEDRNQSNGLEHYLRLSYSHQFRTLS